MLARRAMQRCCADFANALNDWKSVAFSFVCLLFEVDISNKQLRREVECARHSGDRSAGRRARDRHGGDRMRTRAEEIAITLQDWQAGTWSHWLLQDDPNDDSTS
jgi:hypothetical protein